MNELHLLDCITVFLTEGGDANVIYSLMLYDVSWIWTRYSPRLNLRPAVGLESIQHCRSLSAVSEAPVKVSLVLQSAFSEHLN